MSGYRPSLAKPRRGSAPGRHLVLAALFLPGACACFLVAWLHSYPAWLFDQYGVASTARVLSASGAAQGRLLNLGYVLPDGTLQQVRLRARAGTNPQPGQTVPIIYLSHRPEAVRLGLDLPGRMPNIVANSLWWFLAGGVAFLGLAIQRVGQFLRALRGG